MQVSTLIEGLECYKNFKYKSQECREGPVGKVHESMMNLSIDPQYLYESRYSSACLLHSTRVGDKDKCMLGDC